MKQRDIILVPFPFSDQTGKKVRPALILSNDEYNKTSSDVIICAITAALKATKYSIEIDSSNLEQGILYEKSLIKAENLAKIQKSLIIKTIGTLKKPIFSKVISMLNELIKVL